MAVTARSGQHRAGSGAFWHGRHHASRPVDPKTEEIGLQGTSFIKADVEWQKEKARHGGQFQFREAVLWRGSVWVVRCLSRPDADPGAAARDRVPWRASY